MSWISTTSLAPAATPREDGALPSTGWSTMASRPIAAEPVLVPRAIGVRGLMAGLSQRRAAAAGWLLITAAAAMAIPAYSQTLPLGEIAVGEAAAPLYSLLAVAPAVILTAAGLLARWSHPGSRIGVLLIAEGLAWTVGMLPYAATYIPAASEVAALTGFVGYAIGGHILLSYPTGRLRSTSDRVLVALLYVACGPAIMLAFAFHASYGPGCSLCLANAFLITPDDALDVAANASWYAAVGVLIVLTGLRSVPRWRAATPLSRRSLAPVYLTRWVLVGTIVVWTAAGIGMIFTDTVLWQLRAQVPINLAVIAAAAGIVVVFTRSTTARGAAGRLARELDTTPLSAGRLERSLRSALGDPNARLLFRDAAGTAWVDSDGRAVSPTGSRSITTFGGPGDAALEHDPALEDDPAVVEAVGAVAGLALEAERLRVLMRAGGDAGAPRPDGTPGLRGVLTTREREVLALVAEGMTDGAIAQRLYLTRRTVETHIGHVFAKLDVPAGSSHNRRVHAVRRYLDAAEEPTAAGRRHEIR
jgi:DNA-binding CsgD family transcriptional regulator